jgi:GTPase SAR1 family protein
VGDSLLLGGEAGVGKTALLRRLVAELPDPVIAMRGQCDALRGGRNALVFPGVPRARRLRYRPHVDVHSGFTRAWDRFTSSQ